jgi:protein-tyrosine phosphatase
VKSASSSDRTGHDELMQTGPRLLALAGAYNFRDLGGYRTVDGRVTRWGRMFRSDTLHELSGADLQVLREIGLVTVIDLRTTAEVERSGRGLLLAEPVRYLHLPLIQELGEESPDLTVEAREDLAQRYLWYLDAGRSALVEALGALADPTSHPCVFHCAAGKDRTGVLAALLLDILGVEQEIIVGDYVLTATRMDLIIARVRRESPDGVDVIAETPQFLLRAEAATIEQFLALLYRQHGGGQEWARSAGVPAKVLDDLSALLLEADGHDPMAI